MPRLRQPQLRSHPPGGAYRAGVGPGERTTASTCAFAKHHGIDIGHFFISGARSCHRECVQPGSSRPRGNCTPPLKGSAEIGETEMATYRIYFVGQHDHFHGAENIECTTDDEALGCALERIGAFPPLKCGATKGQSGGSGLVTIGRTSEQGWHRCRISDGPLLPGAPTPGTAWRPPQRAPPEFFG